MSVRDGTGSRSQEGYRGKSDAKDGREWRENEMEDEKARAEEGGGGGLVAAERRATAQWGKLIAEIWVQCKRVARLGLTGGL